jgi:uncharacterized DUF497 family protein
MQIVWDEFKRHANIKKHGLDFASLSAKFFDEALVFPAKLGRRQAIGELEPGVIVVIFTTLASQGLSVISMRPANRREKALHEETKNPDGI